MPSFPSDWDAVMAPAVYDWAVAALERLPGDWTVVWGRQNAPRAAAMPFVVLDLVETLQPSGYTSTEILDDLTTERVSVPGRGRLQVDVFQATHDRVALRALELSLSRGSVRDALAAAGLVVWPDRVRDVSQVKGGGYEYRGRLDCWIKASVELDTAGADWIETAESALDVAT